jgi:LacI family transcriptional regulator
LDVIQLSYQNGETVPTEDIVPWLGACLRTLPRPLGLMVHYDVEADFAVHACLEAGLRIPDDIAIVSVDNDPVHCELGQIPLTSIDCNFNMVGYQAAALLDALMKGEASEETTIRVPPREIVIRQSSDALKIDIEPLRKALVYIAQNFTEDITSDSIATAAGLSRRQVYRLFEEHLGRTIHDEVLKRRIEYAKRLLVSTTNKIDIVAHYSGFGSAEQFSKTFHREVGITPSTFRRQSAGTSQ